MAITKNEIQVEWSTADTISVSSGGNQTSDVVTLSAAAFDASLQIKADNAGTPASGDIITGYVLYSYGDPDVDPDSADEFDTIGHAIPFELDTNSEDPVIRSIKIDPAAVSLKLYVANGASSNSITVSAQVREILG